MAPGAETRQTFFYVLQDALRILFVDDDPILREFAQVHLTTEAATVGTAEDGVDALGQMRLAPPDIVLLDLEMPRMDGFEVLYGMRADPLLRRVPVIVVTGREDIAAVDRAFQAGATSFVVKPLNWRLLSHQIRYIHRTHVAETQASTALEGLCRAGSAFLSQALQASPDLRALAPDYLAALEAAHKAARRPLSP